MRTVPFIAAVTPVVRSAEAWLGLVAMAVAVLAVTQPMRVGMVLSNTTTLLVAASLA